MTKVEYSSNNSGGRWWLKDADWTALEAAGWKVKWCRDQARDSSFLRADKDGRWLGALATKAERDCDDPIEAIREFERITGQDASDEGCNCCGAPHSFEWGEGDTRQYVSGEEIASLLSGLPRMSYRELVDALAKKGGA